MMCFEKVKKKLIRNKEYKAKRKAWKDRFICYADGVPKIETEQIWNKHTKERSIEKGYMTLLPYWIDCSGIKINYGLDNLKIVDIESNDWELIK